MSIEYMNLMNNIKTPIKKEYKPKIEIKRIYTPVAYSKKDEIKKLGSLWDSKRKLWYVTVDNINKNEIIEISKDYLYWRKFNNREINAVDFSYKEV